MYILASFVEDKVSIGVWFYLWAFYFVPLIYISVFVPVPYCLDDCGFVVEPGQAGWFLQFHPSFSRLLWLFEGFFCIPIQIVKLFVLALHYIFLKFYLFFNWRIMALPNFVFCQTSTTVYLVCISLATFFSNIVSDLSQ